MTYYTGQKLVLTGQSQATEPNAKSDGLDQVGVGEIENRDVIRRQSECKQSIGQFVV